MGHRTSDTEAGTRAGRYCGPRGSREGSDGPNPGNGAEGLDAEGSSNRARVAPMSLRIALFTDSYLPTVDGVVTSVLATRRELEAHGHRVFTFAPEDPNNGHHVGRDTIFVKAKEFRPYPGYRLAMFPGRGTGPLKASGIDVI